MPELPEVEIIRRQLERLIVGQTISSIEVLNPGSFRAIPNDLIGKTFKAVGRKGKILILVLKESKKNQKSKIKNQKLFVHLKMSGQLEFEAKGQRLRAKGEKSKHLRVYLSFNGGDQLLFHDQRKFGWITTDAAVLPRGIDALDPSLSSNKLAKILASSSRPMKQILLDQSKIAGVGNIYASEILWEAGVSPMAVFRAKGRAKGRDDMKFAKLLAAIRKILNEAIDSGGSTMNDQLYRHVSGQAGDYWSRRRVYDLAGEPCRRPACRKAGTLIQRTLIGQRSTYWCPACQRLTT